MSPRATEIAGRVLLVGLPGPRLDRPLADRLRRLQPAGIILFRRNLTTPHELLELLAGLRELLPYPLLVAIDQEGGRISRLEPWIGPTPTASRLAELGRSAIARHATLTGKTLRALGINLNFAPVVDLCGGDAGNGIDDRAYGADAGITVRLAAAYLDGLQATGIAGCLKHFPGLGRTGVDSHLELPVVSATERELAATDLRPFRELAPRAASVMVAHGHYTAWDPAGPLPASASPKIVGLLRHGFGFRGLVVSDDLEMGAVSRLDTAGDYALQALLAGCDLLLYCSDLDRAEHAYTALRDAAESQESHRSRLGSAAVAVTEMARRWDTGAGSAAAWRMARAELATWSAGLA